jgi:prepilin-type N-terminal cleavage/methylation domain-containing protein
MPTRRNAFTLVELLVVIGIIALLISILLPALSRARTQAVKVQCAAQLRQWGLGLAQYSGENKGSFPYNGPVDLTWCPVGGKDLSWTSSIVQQFTADYLLKNKSLGDLAKNNVLFCPTQIYHRDATVASDPTLANGLIGYFYLPFRVTTAPGGTMLNYAPPTNPDGVGWVEKRKFAQEFKFAPIMSDMLQFNSAGTSWNYYSSHPGKKNFPDGGNFLFEDGHVKWYRWDQIDIGAAGGGWECRYKVDLNW